MSSELIFRLIFHFSASKHSFFAYLPCIFPCTTASHPPFSTLNCRTPPPFSITISAFTRQPCRTHPASTHFEWRTLQHPEERGRGWILNKDKDAFRNYFSCRNCKFRNWRDTYDLLGMKRNHSHRTKWQQWRRGWRQRRLAFSRGRGEDFREEWPDWVGVLPQSSVGWNIFSTAFSLFSNKEGVKARYNFNIFYFRYYWFEWQKSVFFNLHSLRWMYLRKEHCWLWKRSPGLKKKSWNKSGLLVWFIQNFQTRFCLCISASFVHHQRFIIKDNLFLVSLLSFTFSCKELKPKIGGKKTIKCTTVTCWWRPERTGDSGVSWRGGWMVDGVRDASERVNSSNTESKQPKSHSKVD